jgi:hypothetical protein
MSTIAAAVFDVVAETGGCSMREAIKALPNIERETVISAVHRLSEKGVLRTHREFGEGAVYALAPGATRPIDGRGRPRKHEESTRGLESSPATLRSEASG